MKKQDKGRTLFFTHCSHCGKRIIIYIGNRTEQEKRKLSIHGLYSCNACVPENSSARDDINEPYLTDISSELFGEETKVILIK